MHTMTLKDALDAAEKAHWAYHQALSDLAIQFCKAESPSEVARVVSEVNHIYTFNNRMQDNYRRNHS